MKNLKRPLVLVSTLIVVCLLVSWNLFDDSRTPTMFGSTAGDEILPQANRRPAAEDVLVQRIPGDNGHVLIMAYYSKVRFSGPSITINYGSGVVLRDDGKGDDKVAGDGFYTAKIAVDLAAFRSQALGLVQKMKAGKFEPVTYLNRQRIMDPDAAENFDLIKFEANQPVSVTGLNNTLSADAKPTDPGAAALPSLADVRKKSVFITDLSVVEDLTRTWNFKTQSGNINGPWSFKTLMRNLASKNSAQVVSDEGLSIFTLNWLKQFTTTQTVNGDVVAPRPIANTILIAPWLARSKANGAPDGQLDFRFAPFKLTAITNRFDLRDGEPFGNLGEPSGEARFIFTMVSEMDTVNATAGLNIHIGDPLKFNVILESRVNTKNDFNSKKAWAQQWVNLANLTLPSQAYNTALQKITDQFAAIGNSPSSPNQNSLSQLRTNEITLEDLRFGVGTWQLREFNLVNNGNTQSNGKGKVDLKMGTDKQATNDKLNGAGPISTPSDVQRLVNFVNQNQTGINSGFFSVPNSFQGPAFMAGVSRVLGFPIDFNFGPGASGTGYHWDGSGSAIITDDNARFNFSLQTCSGCHGGEAQTFFTHVDNVAYGTEATLSGFVSGKGGQLNFVVDGDGNNTDDVFSVKDPALRPTSDNRMLRPFNEIDRRAKDLLNVVSASSSSVMAISSELLFQPLSSVD